MPSKRAASSRAGVATNHTAGMAWSTSRGWKLKKVDLTTGAVTAPIGAARLAK